MKFSTAIVTLLAASSAYTYSIEKRDEAEDMFNKLKDEMENHQEDIESQMNKMNNQASSSSGSNPFDNTNFSLPTSTPGQVSQECQEIIKKYRSSCFSEEKDYDKYCKNYNNEECVKLRQTPLTSNEACKDAKFEEESLKGMFETVDIQCSYDNDGNLCPVSENQKKNVGRSKNNRIQLGKEDFMNSCKAESCRKIALNIIGSLKNATEAIPTGQNKANDEINEIYSHLQSDKCIAETKKSDAKSDANTIKITGAALASTLAVFLYYFF